MKHLYKLFFLLSSLFFSTNSFAGENLSLSGFMNMDNPQQILKKTQDLGYDYLISNYLYNRHDLLLFKQANLLVIGYDGTYKTISYKNINSQFLVFHSNHRIKYVLSIQDLGGKDDWDYTRPFSLFHACSPSQVSW